MFFITSRENPQIKAAVRLRASASERCALGKFFLEGFRLCRDAVRSGYTAEQLFLTAGARAKYDIAALEQSALQVYEISDAVAQKLGDTLHPQGVFAVCGIKEPDEPFWRGKHYIALENVQDPGNLGTVARTAEALGFDGLLCGGGCDLYHPKALRASMGALLRLPAIQTDDFCSALRAVDLSSYAAVPGSDAVSVLDCDFTRGGVLVIGSEGDGLTPQAIESCDCRITIPMADRAESLNAAAAAAILMWEIRRQTADGRRQTIDGRG